MTRDVPSVSATASVSDAVNKLAALNLRRIIVIDSRGRVAGVVSQRDVLRYFLRLRTDQPDEPIGDPQQVEVSQLLGDREAVTVHSDLPLLKAALLLATNQIGCLPVVNQRAELEGMLSVTDLMQKMTGRDGWAYEENFRFYAPESGGGSNAPPAFIRRANQKLVVPLAAIEDAGAIKEHVCLGYDVASARVLVKFVDDDNAGKGGLHARRDGDNLVIDAEGFVKQFELAGKVSAFDVSCLNESRYLVLTPRPSS